MSTDDHFPPGPPLQSGLPPGLHVDRRADETRITQKALFAGQWGYRLLLILVGIAIIGGLAGAAWFSAQGGFSIWTLLLAGAAWLAYEFLAPIWFNGTIVIITPADLRMLSKPWPTLLNDWLFHNHFEREEIEQLYVKKPSKSGDLYQLMLVSPHGDEEQIMATFSMSEALYLEYEIERLLDLENASLVDAVESFPVQWERTFAAWPDLAEKNGLQLVTQGANLVLAGPYNGSWINFVIAPVDDPTLDGFQATFQFELFEPESALTLSLSQARELFALPPDEISLDGAFIPDPERPGAWRYQSEPPPQDETVLQFLLDRGSTLSAGYQSLVELGTTLIPHLEPVAGQTDHPFAPLARHILRDIAAASKARLKDGPARMICGHCFSTVGSKTADLGQHEQITYFTCRGCGRDDRFLPVAGEVIAVIDEGMSTRYEVRGDDLRVNWLRYRQLFDFEALEMVRTDDETIERLAIQAGNDTDAQRRARYPDLPYTIDPACTLSENTRRILRHTFGQATNLRDSTDHEIEPRPPDSNSGHSVRASDSEESSRTRRHSTGRGKGEIPD